MRGPDLRRRARGLRRLGLALALVCFGGQLSSVVHMITVRHSTCTEHGELIDSDGATPARRASADTAFEVADASARHSHDHCPVSAATPRGNLGVAPVAAASTPAAPRPSAGPARRAIPLPRPVPLLLLAPKSSPPA